MTTRKRTAPWPLIIVSLAILFFVGLIGLIFIAAVIGGGSAGVGQHVALLNFYGPIADTESGKLFGAPGPRDFIEKLDAARRDKSAKAIVIRINSPGGTPAASQEMYRAIRRARAEKPVVCSMGDVAASGGYYMASACDKIYANPSTLTASIGVISQFMNFEGLMKKLGISDATLTSGQFKDAGSPFRALKPEERQLFQAMIKDIYGQFVDDVVDGRKAATNGKLTRAALLKVADGRVLTGRQAKAKLLVDEMGGLREAVDAAGKLGGIKGTPVVRESGGGSGLGSLMGSSASTPGSGTAGAMQSLGSAFAQGFAQTFLQRMREDGSTPALPQAR
jgi:protease-4